MIEDEDPQVVEQSGEALLYDYFKHLTSLCLFSLGGVVAMVDRARGVKPALLVAVMVVIGFAAILSFGGAAEIVRARFQRTAASKYLNFYRLASPLFLSFGVGMFLWLFAEALLP